MRSPRCSPSPSPRRRSHGTSSRSRSWTARAASPRTSAIANDDALPTRRLRRRRKAHHARVLLALGPAVVEAQVQHRRADAACEMVAAHAPVEAGPAHWTALLRQRREVDADLAAILPALRGELEPGVGRAHELPLLEAIEREHAEIAREVVVADARLAQRRLARARAHAHPAHPIRDAHQALEEIPHAARRRAEIAMAPLAFP